MCTEKHRLTRTLQHTNPTPLPSHETSSREQKTGKYRISRSLKAKRGAGTKVFTLHIIMPPLTNGSKSKKTTPSCEQLMQDARSRSSGSASREVKVRRKGIKSPEEGEDASEGHLAGRVGDEENQKPGQQQTPQALEHLRSTRTHTHTQIHGITRKGVKEKSCLMGQPAGLRG